MKTFAAVILVVVACSGASKPATKPPQNQPDEPVAAPAPKAEADFASRIGAGVTEERGTGALHGVIRDAHGEVVIGATVVAQSDALEGSQTAITDEEGQFVITSLPPGHYTITLYYSDVQTEGAVDIADGRRTELQVTGFDTEGGGEVIQID